VGVASIFQFFFNNSSAMRRTQILMTGLLLRTTPYASIGHTQILGGKAPRGGSAFMFFCLFFVIFLRSTADQTSCLSNISTRRGSWWPREAANASWHFQPRVTWWPGTKFPPLKCMAKILTPHISGNYASVLEPKGAKIQKNQTPKPTKQTNIWTQSVHKKTKKHKCTPTP